MERLAEVIENNLEFIATRWAEKAARRLGLETSKEAQLINDIPEVLTDLVEALRTRPEAWRATSAKKHAQQRVRLGVDIGGLSEEFGMVGETILEFASEKEARVGASETSLMLRFLARATAESVTEFARLSALEMHRQSAEHFSFVAHELRTPLQSAQLALRFAKDSLEQSEREPVGFDRLGTSLARLSNLIDNSLIDARLTSEPELNKEATTSTEILSDAVQQSAALAKQRGIEIEVDAEKFEFDADRRLMVSTMTNLIVNGVKFSRPGSRVLVKGAVKDERVHLEVHDSCGGLPDGAASKMFKQFAQVGKDRSGFGLGLMIVKQAVEAHGGRVRVENVPGDGCRILVEVPRRQGRLSRIAQAKKDPSR